MVTRSTLMGYTKAQLIDRIECLEHNNAVLSESLDQQYSNAIKLLAGMDILNATYQKAKQNSLGSDTAEQPQQATDTET